jgi:hypothetical protein
MEHTGTPTNTFAYCFVLGYWTTVRKVSITKRQNALRCANNERDRTWKNVVVADIIVRQGFTHFRKIQEPPQNSGFQKSDKKQFSYWESTDITLHPTEYRRPELPQPCYMVLLSPVLTVGTEENHSLPWSTSAPRYEPGTFEPKCMLSR